MAVGSGTRIGHRLASRHVDYELPPERATLWQPGVSLNGGIPVRADTTPLTPSGGNDADEINAAIAAAPANGVVMLGPGEFKIYGVGQQITINRNNVTLRGTLGPSGEWRTTIRHYRTDGVTKGIERFSYLPEFVDGGYQYVRAISVGPAFPSWDNTTAVRLAEDAVKGTSTAKVTSTTGLAAGQYIVIDEAHWPTARYEEMPPHFDGSPHPYMVYRSDKLAWRHHWKRFSPNIGTYWPNDDMTSNTIDQYDPGTGQRPNNALGWWARGAGRNYNEIKKIIDVNTGTNTLTFEHPLHTTYRVSHLAEVCRTTSTIVEGVGIEDLAIANATAAGVAFNYVANSWIKNVEVREWLGYGVDLTMCYRCELTGSYLHHAAWPVPGGGGYALAVGPATSDTLIEDCVMNDANKVNVVYSGGAGCVMGYCYADNGYVWGRPQGDWVETGPQPAHFTGGHGMAFVGNLTWNAESEGTHGTSIECVWFRNHLTGKRRDFTGMGNSRIIGLGAYSGWMSFIGNVLGQAGQMAGWTYTVSGSFSGATQNVLKIGYDDQDWDQTQDRVTATTTLLLENYDHLSSSRKDQTSLTLPRCLYRKAKPPFFEVGDTWPWVDPITGTTHTLPAKRRFDQRWSARDHYPIDAALTLTGIAPTRQVSGGASFSLTGDFAEGTSTSPSVSHTITAGRGQFALITASEDVTCTPPSGWTADQSVSVFSTQRYCTFYILSATGSESTTFTLSGSANWTISIWQGSGAFSSLVTSAATAENADPMSTDAVSVTAGNLVIAGMGNEVAFVATAPPSGYTHPTPTGASSPHYGTNTVMMGSVAYRVAPSSGTEDPSWDVDQPVFSGIGVHVFAV